MNPHFKALEAAYQLHFYLRLKTRYSKPIFEDKNFVENVLSEICLREEYHLLKTNISRDHLRLLLSLKPTQPLSQAVRLLKGNLDHRFRLNFPSVLERSSLKSPLAKGYFAISSGKVNLDAARGYVDNQVSHHGYKGNRTKALKYKNPSYKSPAFQFDHCFCLLRYHIVLATHRRLPLFDESIAPQLFKYVISIGTKHLFSIDRIGLLPDHMHVVLEAVPSVSVEQFVQAIMENTRYWLTTKYDGVLRQFEAWDVWESSYYAGTVGEYSTAQVKRFLTQGRN